MSAALRLRGVPCVLVGDGPTLERARELVADRLGARGRKPLVPFVPGAPTGPTKVLNIRLNWRASVKSSLAPHCVQ